MPSSSGAFGSTVLDVAIGLVFLYLLLAITVSVVNELIAQVLALRAATLEQGLRRLLEGATSEEQKKAEQPDAAASRAVPEASGATETAGSGRRDLVSELYRHPLLLGMSSTKGSLKPSYIPARQFALALLDLIAPNAKPGQPDYWSQLDSEINKIQNDHLKEALQALARGAHEDASALRENVERWFNDAMDRVSGWYKRKVRMIVLVLGLGFALLLNADTLGIAQALWLDPTLRAGVAAVAQDYVSHPPQQGCSSDPTKCQGDLTTVSKNYLSSGIPLGWRAFPQGPDLARELVGLALTTLAVSLGAPFWFDTRHGSETW